MLQRLTGPDSWIGRTVESLYGEARLQRARPSFITRNPLYRRWREWLTANNHERAAIQAIKLFHSGAFLILAGAVLIVAWSCAMDRFTRATRWAAVAVVSESAIILVNGGRCPLTSVVEDLGAEHGSVSDIFLPDRLARNIPQVSTALLGTGIVLLTARRLLRRVRYSGLNSQ
jgi:hypothetical protein